MALTPFPVSGNLSRVALTGFASPVQLSGQVCKSVIISACRVISGLSGGASSNNSDVVLIGVGATPAVVTAYTGIPLAAGEMIEFNVADASMIWLAGASGDSVTVTILN